MPSRYQQSAFGKMDFAAAIGYIFWIFDNLIIALIDSNVYFIAVYVIKLYIFIADI